MPFTRIKEKKSCRPGLEKCEYCGHRFSEDERITIIEESFFAFGRGDDEVHAFCLKHHVHFDKSGLRVIPSKNDK